MVPEAKPWRSAFWEDLALPDSVFGPVDFELDGCGAMCVFSPASVQQEEIWLGADGRAKLFTMLHEIFLVFVL